MAYSWRPTPPQPPPPMHGGDVCPVCYYSHFPFCPPPPLYPPNPRLHYPPPHPAQFHHRPPPPPPPHPPAYDPHRLIFDPYANSNSIGDFGHGAKRMRTDDCSSVMNESYSKSARVSVDDERRLKLIRDHGGDGDLNSKQGYYEMQSNGYRFNNFPANNYNNVDSKNHSFSNAYSEFYPNQNGSAFVNRHGASRPFAPQPPLPPSPPPPLPAGNPGRLFYDQMVSSSPSGPMSSSLFPIHAGTSPSMPSYPAVTEEAPKAKVIDASQILKHPSRITRPDHIVVILRGLPGSGKSYLAKMLRDLEVENGGNAPRIHSIDDYFMTEVEKVDESEVSKSAGSSRAKKTVKKVIEYCYELEMEEAYRSSMLKAFKKTLDEGVFSFVIVDDRNLRVADFAQFWATAKRSGYEVYVLEAPYKDPAGCAARNVHGFTLDEIQKLSGQWEEAPPLYMKLDIKSLIHGDNLERGAIQEVDMDMEEDGDREAGPSTSEQENVENAAVPTSKITSDGQSKGDLGWDDEAEHPIDSVKDLGKSKWSTDLDEDDIKKDEIAYKKPNALSGLIQSYRKEGKKVRWGDQAFKGGFSIGATKAANVSLVIGPGAGYNYKSNPLQENEKMTLARGSQTKRQGVFQEQLRAEQESFKAVFDRRRQRIGGLNPEDE